jgi:hypothetical protein
MNLFYKIHLQAFNVISTVLYHSGPTFGKVLYSCLDAFVVDASDYSGHPIRHLLKTLTCSEETAPWETLQKHWGGVQWGDLSNQTHQQRRCPDRNTRYAQTLDRCDKAQWRLHCRPLNVFCKINSFLKSKHTACRTFEMTHVLRCAPKFRKHMLPQGRKNVSWKKGKKFHSKQCYIFTHYRRHYHHHHKLQPSNLKYGFPLELAPSKLYTTFDPLQSPMCLSVAVTADLSKNNQISWMFCTVISTWLVGL